MNQATHGDIVIRRGSPIATQQDHIRRHIRIFINGTQVTDLAQPLTESDEVIIVQALSGG